MKKYYYELTKIDTFLYRCVVREGILRVRFGGKDYDEKFGEKFSLKKSPKPEDYEWKLMGKKDLHFASSAYQTLIDDNGVVIAVGKWIDIISEKYVIIGFAHNLWIEGFSEGYDKKNPDFPLCHVLKIKKITIPN